MKEITPERLVDLVLEGHSVTQILLEYDKNIIFSVQRVLKKEDSFYGYVHATLGGDPEETLCGLKIKEDGTWYLRTLPRGPKIDCPKCLRKM